MAVFSVPDHIVVESGDKIELKDRMDHKNTFCRVKCAYKVNRTNEIITEVDDIDKDDLTEGYHEWKKRHWRKLFDPFAITIESIDIQMLPK